MTFVVGANGGPSFVVEGTESNLNAALEGLSFIPTGNYFEQASSIAIVVQALSADGSSSNRSFTITIQDVVEPPLAIVDFFVVIEGQGFNSVAGWLVSNEMATP